MAETTEKYSADIGTALNAYVACVIARATGNGYDVVEHQRAAEQLDQILAALDGDRALVDYLCDWFSGGSEIVIAAAREPGARLDKESSDAGLRDRLWVNEFEDARLGIKRETVRDALRDAVAHA